MTWLPDKIRTSSLYIPATLVFTTLYIGIVSSRVNIELCSGVFWHRMHKSWKCVSLYKHLYQQLRRLPPFVLDISVCQSYELPFVRMLFNPLVLLLLGAFPIYKAVTKVTEQFLFKVAYIVITALIIDTVLFAAALELCC